VGKKEGRTAKGERNFGKVPDGETRVGGIKSAKRRGKKTENYAGGLERGKGSEKMRTESGIVYGQSFCKGEGRGRQTRFTTVKMVSSERGE